MAQKTKIQKTISYKKINAHKVAKQVSFIEQMTLMAKNGIYGY